MLDLPQSDDVALSLTHPDAMIHQVQGVLCEKSHQRVTQPKFSNPQYTVVKENMML